MSVHVYVTVEVTNGAHEKWRVDLDKTPPCGGNPRYYAEAIEDALATLRERAVFMAADQYGDHRRGR